MRLLQLDPNGNEATALDLHPVVTVVTDLSASGRERLVRAATALPRGNDPGSPGLIEAHGILLDLSAAMLAVLDLHDDRSVIVTAGEVAAAGDRLASVVHDPEAALRLLPPGTHPELDALRARRSQAQQALVLLREACDAARVALEDAQVTRRRAELALESASTTRSRSLLRLVTEDDDPTGGPDGGSGGVGSEAVDGGDATAGGSGGAGAGDDSSGEVGDAAGGRVPGDGAGADAIAGGPGGSGEGDGALGETGATPADPAADAGASAGPPEAGDGTGAAPGDLDPAGDGFAGPGGGETEAPAPPAEPVPDDPEAVEARRRELVAVVARIERGVKELAAVDVRPVQVLLDAIHDPTPTELAPSERARELADELVVLQQREAELDHVLEGRGLGYRSAMRRLDSARASVAAAEHAMRPPEFTEQDRVDLEAAHDEVLDAEGRARGRAGRRRLEEAVVREQEILDRMGFPTWSAYVMGSTLMGIDPAAEHRLEQARFELDAAERHWSEVAARIESDPEHRQLLDRLEAVYVESFELLGGEEGDEQDHADLVDRLRDVREPAREVSHDELIDALVYQLELIGMGLPREGMTAERIVLVAEAFLAEAAAIQDRITELTAERLDALTELRTLDERLARPAGTGRGDHPSLGPAPGDHLGGHDMTGLEAQVREARAGEAASAELVEAREALVDTAIQIETVASGKLRKRAMELAAELAAPDAGGGDVAVDAVASYLRQRVDAVRGVSYAGSVPLLLDEALAPLAEEGRRTVLDRLDPLADAVQIVYLTRGDPAVLAWADAAGFERATVVRAPAEFA